MSGFPEKGPLPRGSAARRVSFSERSGIQKSLVASRPSGIGWDLAQHAEFYQLADAPVSAVERQKVCKISEPFVLLTERVYTFWNSWTPDVTNNASISGGNLLTDSHEYAAARAEKPRRHCFSGSAKKRRQSSGPRLGT